MNCVHPSDAHAPCYRHPSPIQVAITRSYHRGTAPAQCFHRAHIPAESSGLGVGRSPHPTPPASTARTSPPHPTAVPIWPSRGGAPTKYSTPPAMAHDGPPLTRQPVGGRFRTTPSTGRPMRKRRCAFGFDSRDGHSADDPPRVEPSNYDGSSPTGWRGRWKRSQAREGARLKIGQSSVRIRPLPLGSPLRNPVRARTHRQKRSSAVHPERTLRQERAFDSLASRQVQFSIAARTPRPECRQTSQKSRHAGRLRAVPLQKLTRQQDNAR